MTKADTAILCGVKLSNTVDIEYELKELSGLARAQNIEVKDAIYQTLDHIHPKTYVGSGKALELKQMVDILKVDMVIFNDTLSPSQINHLEEILNVQIIDRSFLILSIFASRAQSKIAKLEVSLAQKLYMLPRLIGLGKTLSRQGGGSFNAKGPGETKLELDRRKLLTEISSIKRNLNLAQKEKLVTRKKRQSSKIPIVALVGYTNVGKSSLVNALSKYLHDEENVVFEKDMLFATLDTKTIKLQKKGYPHFLLIDTVGFIAKLPHELVNSFKSTLSDLLDADLLIQVIDGAFYNQDHLLVTQNILNALDASSLPSIFVLTKKDMQINDYAHSLGYIHVSNKTLENIDLVVEEIYANIYHDYRTYQLKIPYDEGHFVSQIHQSYHVIKQEMYDDFYLLKLFVKPYEFEQLKRKIYSS